jgi:hypothetical protein
MLAAARRVFGTRGLNEFTPGLQINYRHPIAQGLHYVRTFQDFNPAPLLNKGKSEGTLTRNSITVAPAGQNVGLLGGGIGMQGSATSSGMLNATTNAYTVPRTRGSFFTYQTADFTAADSLNHYLMLVGPAATDGFSLLKFTDNNLYFGWVIGGSGASRITFSATNQWSAGNSFIIGGTWYPTNMDLWIASTKKASLGSGPTTMDTATGSNPCFEIANLDSTLGGGSQNRAWGRVANKNGIYWIAFWERNLGDDEIRYLAQNPYCFFNSREWELPGSLAFTSAKSRGYVIG